MRVCVCVCVGGGGGVGVEVAGSFGALVSDNIYGRNAPNVTLRLNSLYFAGKKSS